MPGNICTHPQNEDTDYRTERTLNGTNPDFEGEKTARFLMALRVCKAQCRQSTPHPRQRQFATKKKNAPLPGCLGVLIEEQCTPYNHPAKNMRKLVHQRMHKKCENAHFLKKFP